ncbi:hypothetical protein PGTUg99_025293 [Puccinia graminis f. sp. tritici]|uniref:Uncharacterized protein n=1 Tax=Puccinia graminis f. sp. tritici TaxID=56615 RepID=A0A5B0R669_PUCGR|nr:hypothetical protein PGTUg99_025293 [Puccinia graminis f. sp. tritici]
MTRKRNKPAPKGCCGHPEDVGSDLVGHLVHRFDEFYHELLGPKAEFPPWYFFGLKHAQAINKCFDQICTPRPHDEALLERVIGGASFPGQIGVLNQALTEWIEGDVYQQHRRNVAALDCFIAEEGLRVRDRMAADLASYKAEAEAKRVASKTAKAEAQAAEKA